MNLDAAFFKPFVDGTLHTLKVSCSMEAKSLKPFIKGKGEQPSFDIAGVIGLTSSGFVGTIAICFPEKVYLAAMSSMLGENYTSITTELQDGAAELLNMIFGHAKVVLNQQGHTIQKAIPTVVRGIGLQTNYLGKASVIVLPFSTIAGEIHMEICADSNT
jgi:CheY-specific phosphatase CheX